MLMGEKSMKSFLIIGMGRYGGRGIAVPADAEPVRVRAEQPAELQRPDRA